MTETKQTHIPNIGLIEHPSNVEEKEIIQEWNMCHGDLSLFPYKKLLTKAEKKDINKKNNEKVQKNKVKKEKEKQHKDIKDKIKQYHRTSQPFYKKNRVEQTHIRKDYIEKLKMQKELKNGVNNDVNNDINYNEFVNTVLSEFEKRGHNKDVIKNVLNDNTISNDEKLKFLNNKFNEIIK